MDPASVMKLVEMGFPKDAVVAALKCTSDVDAAMELLLSETVSSDQEDSAQQSTHFEPGGGGGKAVVSPRPVQTSPLFLFISEAYLFRD